MKLEKICRTCLNEKTNLKPLFDACVPNMIMSFVQIQLIQGDGLPHQICLQCLNSVNKAYAFKQLCEKSDATLQNFINIQLQPIQPMSLPSDNMNLIEDVDNIKTDLFSTSEILQQTSSLFNDIFNDAGTHSFVDNFTPQHANTVVSDLAETMQSLQTIAEQCLPESWENENENFSNNLCPIIDDTATNNFNIDTIFKCQFCEDMFKDEWSLGEHIKDHTGQNNKYFCTDITTELTRSMLLEYTLDNSKDNLLETTNNLLCNVCDRTFTDQKYLKKHLRDIHFMMDTISVFDEKKHVCSICGKRFRLNKTLTLHMRNHTGERPLKCDLCGRTFALPSSLHKHKKIHQEHKMYECHICGKKFNQSSNLNCHILTHTREKSHICTICGKTFATNTNLEIHKRLHTGVKPFVCTYCDKGFISSTQLRKHMMVHTGEKPYPCWQCGKSFRRKETRDTHMRYHTGDRPYSCDICHKKYIAASHLRVHMRSHNDDRKYDCMICMKKFLDMKTLKSHIMSHTGQKPYSCQFCGKCFTQQGGLSTHIKSCHNQ